MFLGTWHKPNIQEPQEEAGENRTPLVNTNFQNTVGGRRSMRGF